MAADFENTSRAVAFIIIINFFFWARMRRRRFSLKKARRRRNQNTGSLMKPRDSYLTKDEAGLRVISCVDAVLTNDSIASSH